MASPTLSAGASGAGVTALMTVVLGPVLGEYIIILIAGLLGTLVALSEANTKTVFRSMVFVFRGLAFSFVFTSLLTSIAISFIPASIGVAPYAVMSVVSFLIGWTSNRWGSFKKVLIEELSKKLAKKIADDKGDKE